jgi:hypothetical protein
MVSLVFVSELMDVKMVIVLYLYVNTIYPMFVLKGLWNVASFFSFYGSNIKLTEYRIPYFNINLNVVDTSVCNFLMYFL